MAIDRNLAATLDGYLEQDLQTNARLGKVQRYLRGDHDLPYMPRGAKAEYLHLAQRSITNWTPLLSDTYAKGLYVDGYRATRTTDNAEAWSYWQANNLDSRQSIAHRGALEYGASYTLVLPGTVGNKRVPLIRPLSPLRSAAWYRDEDDEYPELALRRIGTTQDGTRLIEVFDNQNVYTFARPKLRTDGPTDILTGATGETTGGEWILSRTDEHGLGVTPFVRFRDRLDGESVGIIRPIITLQDRVNEIVFSTLIAMQYAAFRQRWATGLAIPEDDNGVPLEPFQSAVDRLWVAEDPTARFGDFAQTELSGHHEAYANTIKTLAAIAQVSPNVFTGDLVNISAEALAQMERATQLKIAEYETLFGESWESTFRLASRSAGNETGAADFSSQVRWRDTEARAFDTTVAALGNMATMLQVPVEGLWDKIPGVTDADITYWKSIRQVDPLQELTAEIARQTAAQNAAAAPTPTPAVTA